MHFAGANDPDSLLYFNNYSQNDFDSLRVSLLHDRSYDSKEAKDGLLYEDSVISKHSAGNLDLDQQEKSIGQQSSIIRNRNNVCKTPESDGYKMMSYEQLKD